MRNKLKVSPFQSLLFVLFFIAPHTIASITPQRHQLLLMAIICFGYLVMFFLNMSITTKIVNFYAFPIIIIPAIGVFLKFHEYGEFSAYNILMPIVGFWGFLFISNMRIRVKYIEYFIYFLLLFFLFTYYSNLPSLFYRDSSFYDGDWYGVSSSNAIPIALINTLYIYIIICYYQKENTKAKITFFSVIVLFFVIVQGSRAGVFVSLLFFIYSLYNYMYVKRNINVQRKFVFLSIIICAVVLYFTQNIIKYADSIGFNEMSSDSRHNARMFFLQNLDFTHFIFGYKSGTIYSANNTYTFNVWLDYWNKYTIIGLITLVFLFLRRFILYKKYFFPLYMFIPFLIYSWVEPRYLPCYWDFFIYLLLLKK